MAFNRAEYDKVHAAQVKKLAGAEKITKEVLRELSRSTLEALHVTEDVAYINKVVSALTPVNRKVAILFFHQFAGFRQENGVFGKKDKSKYEAAKAAAMAFLEDPMNNIWSWAEREVDIAPKEFDINQVTKATERFIKKATDAGMGQADVLRAMFKAGFTPDALLAVMQEMNIGEGVDIV